MVVLLAVLAVAIWLSRSVLFFTLLLPRDSNTTLLASAAQGTALQGVVDRVSEVLIPEDIRQVQQAMPRVSAVRSFVMNHLIHHRGQLSVYLRLKDVPLPPMYGPTADEQ
jgi:hypothetical protein